MELGLVEVERRLGTIAKIKRNFALEPRLHLLHRAGVAGDGVNGDLGGLLRMRGDVADRAIEGEDVTCELPPKFPLSEFVPEAKTGAGSSMEAWPMAGMAVGWK